ncbi:hypothetical protein [Pararhodonellum marinum]|uniref:hypothetical protein n=1 Tax=Pararhodonellum marinum TaxID=2755358 RepID=UPI001890619C|nr:hypothetical protein [Pararhodonellum marinum]
MKSISNPFNYGSLFFILALFILGSCMNENMEAPQLDIEETEIAQDMDDFDDEIGAFLRKNPSNQNQLLAQIRAATAKYHRFEVANADGYELDHCVQHPFLGSMGHHAINEDRIKPWVIPSEPGVLMYEPTRNGRLQLIGVEYLVPAEPWDEENDAPPYLGNQVFDDHREMTLNEKGEPVNAKGGPPFPHYQLHVWLWKNNPSGMYFPFNPNVSCDYAQPVDH